MSEQQLVLNYDGKSTDQIFNIPKERADQIGGIVAEAVSDIATNYSSYCGKGEGDDAGKEFMLRGKMLERLLRGFTDIQEQVFVVSVFHHMIELAAQRAAFLEMKGAFADFVEKLKTKI